MIKIDFSVNFSTINLFQYEYAEFMSNLGVPQSRVLRLNGRGGWQNFEIQGAPLVYGSPQKFRGVETPVQDMP